MRTKETRRSSFDQPNRLLPKAMGAIVLALLGVTASSKAAQGPQPSICTRACWGARAPVCGISQLGALSRAVIHHTASASDFNTTSQATSAANVRAVQNYHIDSRGWCDTGYHFMVCKLGYIFEGRAGSMSSIPVGAHDSVNANSFGFNWMGYFHPPYNQVPTTAMRNSIYDVIAWRMPSAWSAYGGGTYGGRAGVGTLCTHRDAFASACPGDGAYPFITANVNGGEARDGVHARRNGGTPPPPPPPKPGPDFDGNGICDIALFRPSTGTWHLGPGSTPVIYGQAGDIPVPGDYNGDGRADTALFRPSTGTWYLGPGTTPVVYGQNGDLPIPGDYNGDGRTDIAVYRPSTQHWYLGPGTTPFMWGNAGDIPVPGDFNGDGRSDVAIYRPQNRTWYQFFGWAIPYGDPGDIPMPGDWNGDGSTEIGLFRPSTGAWYFGPGSTPVVYGQAGDIPVAGDYNGDGRTDTAVFRPSTGTWYIPFTGTQYGQSGDIPAPSPASIRQFFFPY